MDECLLNDLLECSVCLERLDTSSKVLPCQHTFCKKCLMVILETQKTLRCPECRVLVEINIDDLPPNVLLMRILEGMRNLPRKTDLDSSPSSQPQSLVESDIKKNVPQKQPLSSKDHHSRPRVSNKLHNIRSSTTQPHAIAQYNYTAKEPGDLTFKKGDMILLKKRIDDNWCQGECDGVLGVFPLPYVQVMVSLPSQVPQCKALYDFRKNNQEDEICLNFNKGDMIIVTRRIDEHWAEGKLDSRIGIFPITFVDMNRAAKSLMKSKALSQTGSSRNAPPTPNDETVPLISSEQTTNHENVKSVPVCQIPTSTEALLSPLSSSSASPSSSTSSTAPTTPPSSGESSLSPPSPSFTSPVNHSASKRHSYTIGAIPPPYQAPPAVHRHSAEIMNDEECGALNSSAVESHADMTATYHQRAQHRLDQYLQIKHHRDNAIASDSAHPIQRFFPSVPLPGQPAKFEEDFNIARLGSLRMHTRNGNNRFFDAPPSLPAKYIALYPYKPQKNDELELKEEAIYIVTERCQDGWFKGTSNKNQKTGVFPGNYVTPIRSMSALQVQLRGVLQNSSVANSRERSPPDILGALYLAKPNTSIRTAVTNDNAYLAAPELPPRSLSPAVQSKATSSENHSISFPWLSTSSDSVRAILGKGSGRTVTDNDDGGFSSPSSLTCSGGHKSNHAELSKNTKHEKSEKGKEKKERSSGGGVSLMKRLTGMKKSRSPSPPHCEAAAINDLIKRDENLWNPVSHTRSDSCPSKLTYNVTPTALDNHITSTTSTTASTPSSKVHHRVYSPGNSQRVKQKLRPALHSDKHHSSGFQHTEGSNFSDRMPAISHRKSSSLDTTNLPSSSSTINDSPATKTKPVASPRERYRCIVPYPPNSEFELELRLGDIIYVHKKREDGWYKGTLQRNGRTGLFPSSFVELI